MYIIICAALQVPWNYHGGILLWTILDFVGYIIKEVHRLLPCAQISYTIFKHTSRTDKQIVCDMEILLTFYLHYSK